jgi:hypothetical protein
MSRHRSGRTDQDRGVVLVLMALLITAMLLVVAIVIDFGNVRNTRQDTKRVADLATAAGARSLAPDGKPRPWAGACAALEYLEANRSDLTFTVSYWDGNGPDGGVSVSDPCPVPAPDPDDESDLCVAGEPTSWAWIRATAGDLTVDIRTGYETPDDDFAEDATIYSGQDGETERGGCDQLAIITGASDSAFFGGVAGATGYDTINRSVGRVEIGNREDVAVALVLLEREDCQALSFAGGGGGSGEIVVRGTKDRPGIIHSDSTGKGDACGANNTVIVGKQSPSGPLVRALSAPDDSTQHGIISTYARFLGGTNDAKWTPSRSVQGTEVWMCDPDSGPVVATCSTGPSGNRRVTRKPADDRYLDDIIDLRSEANTVFNQLPAVPDGYTRYTDILGASCTLGGTEAIFELTSLLHPGAKLYVDCPTLSIGNKQQLIIPGHITHVAFQGRITFSGDGLLDIRAPEQVLVHNGGGNTDAIETGSQGRLRINTGGAASCTARTAGAPDAVTEMVIRRGGLKGTAGGSVWLCSTFVHLMGGDTSASPVNTTAAGYPAPYDNPLDGYFSIGGGGGAQWTAPNTILVKPSAGSYRFEDLAVWSETQLDNEISGGGTMVLTGIYFLPNTGPSSSTGGLNIAGAGSGAINLDAQLWVRKLHHNGKPHLTMTANPADSIPLPFLAGTSLVR